MRVFLTGPTGVLGKPTVRRLLDTGHDVAALARSGVAPPSMVQSSLVAEAEVAGFAAQTRTGVVLRMGFFYGPHAGNTREAVTAARRGVAMLVGPASAFLPQVWVDDAAQAVVAALSAPAGIYDVVDDDPLRRGELKALMAQAVGKRRLFAPPLWLVRFLAGREMAFAARSLRVSNRRFKEAAGWTPGVRDARTGWRLIGEALA